MNPDSPTYQKAFQRYLRTGVTVEVQFKARQRSFEAMLRVKYQAAARRASDLVERRIAEIRQALEENDRPFMDIEAPDTTDLEADYTDLYKEMIDHYRAQATDGGNPEQLEERLNRAEDFLGNRFRQQLDPVLQPHFGIGYFTWLSGSANPCGNCASHDGNTYAWGAGEEPPGCNYCQCVAAPAFKPALTPNEQYPDAIEPVYLEFVLIPIMRIGRGSILLGQRLLATIARRQSSNRSNLTEHGVLRSQQRNISAAEEQEAIRSATVNGTVTTKTGKYGTPQLHYRGSNGITVIVETSGRNAGKVITFYRH